MQSDSETGEGVIGSAEMGKNMTRRPAACSSTASYRRIQVFSPSNACPCCGWQCPRSLDVAALYSTPTQEVTQRHSVPSKPHARAPRHFVIQLLLGAHHQERSVRGASIASNTILQLQPHNKKLK